MPSGDMCPKCKSERLHCRSSERISNYQKQYIECKSSKCDYKETHVVPENKVWRRK